MTDIARLRSELAGLKIEDNPAIVKQKSRDFFWYSPVLKRQLDHITADLIVTPQNAACRSRRAAQAPATTARRCREPAAWF
jgi:hypothetical protein